MFEFADPWILLLLPLPFLVIRLLGTDQMAGGAIRVPERIGGALLAAGRKTSGRSRIGLRGGLLWAIWIALLLAVSGPRDLAPVSALKVTGRDLAIALDLSGSMIRDDFHLNGKQITRLDAVKTVLRTTCGVRGDHDVLHLQLEVLNRGFAAGLTHDQLTGFDVLTVCTTRDQVG